MNANVKNTDSTGSVGHADRHWLLQSMGLTVVVIVLAVIFTYINPRFATLANLANVLTQASHYIIIAVAMTFVITSAGIDLSVGSVLALVTVIGFALIKGGMNPALAVVIMFSLGALIGAFTGSLIALIKIPPFIATLGMMY
ncbi:MAG: ABC transporter permease [Granulosicoccus sp.]